MPPGRATTIVNLHTLAIFISAVRRQVARAFRTNTSPT